jgi:hypothetical protein
VNKVISDYLDGLILNHEVKDRLLESGCDPKVVPHILALLSVNDTETVH